MANQTQLDKEIIDSLGLDFQKLTLHQKKIYKVLQGECIPTSPIVDICTIENREIIAWDDVKKIIKNNMLQCYLSSTNSSRNLDWIYQHVITCIPAAGAAARYWRGADFNLLESYAKFPKALLPATCEGDTFLDIKLLEQKELLPTCSNVIIVPLNYKEKFENILFSHTQSKWFVLEQAQALSTIRFEMNGNPYLIEDKRYAPVPAGHGELINLFDEIMQVYPHAYALHFRNIDNIIGIQSQQKEEISLFAESFYLLRSALETVRKSVTDAIKNLQFIQDIQDESYITAIEFLRMIYPTLLPDMYCQSQVEQAKILSHLNKPLSVFGVVKKLPGDQGGGPVFIQTETGEKIKICLEMTHANQQDYDKYFGIDGNLPYFNPVLVFFETKTGSGVQPNFKEFFDDKFWFLSKRQYLNQDVCYHETALYELIGNSKNTNLVFVEVPRSLFKPHKYFLDSIGKSRESYGLNQ